MGTVGVLGRQQAVQDVVGTVDRAGHLEAELTKPWGADRDEERRNGPEAFGEVA